MKFLREYAYSQSGSNLQSTKSMIATAGQVIELTSLNIKRNGLCGVND